MKNSLLLLFVVAIFNVNLVSAQTNVPSQSNTGQKTAVKKSNKKKTRKNVKKIVVKSSLNGSKPFISLLYVKNYYKPVYTQKPVDTLLIIKVPIQLKFPDTPTSINDTILFNFEKFDLPNKPILDNPVMVLSMNTKKDVLDTFIYIRTSTFQDTLKHDVFGVLTISNHQEGFVIIDYLSEINSKKNVDTPQSSKMVKAGMITILNNKPITLKHIFSAAGKPQNQLIEIPIKLNVKYDPVFNKIVAAMDSGYLSNNAFINPLDTSQTISKIDWDYAIDSNHSIYNLKLRITANNLKDTFGYTQTTFIEINGISDEVQEIELNSYHANMPFWVELGSNFDLLNSSGVQPNNLYGGIFMHYKDVGKFRCLGRDRNYSLFGGVYESESISNNQSNSANFQYLSNSVFNPPSSRDTIALIHRDTGTVTKTISITNLGIFFSPQIRLTNKLPDQNGFHIFLSLWTEIVWQRISTNFDYSKSGDYNVDTVPRVNNKKIDSIGYKVFSSNSDYRSHYIGFGLPMYLKYNYYNLYINPVFGTSTQVGIPTNTGSFYSYAQANQYWRSFYLIQFRLNEDHYGFAFTGEVRGVIAPSGNYKPAISLALSKKFDLDKLIEFTKP